MKRINWDTSKDETTLIHKIAKRYAELIKHTEVDLVEVSMDITATHLNGCPLDLDKLNNFDDFNLAHDVGGMIRHINRITGKLQNCFDPRCSKSFTETPQEITY